MIEIASSAGDATPSVLAAGLFASARCARSMMPRQRLVIAAATPNLIPMPTAHAPSIGQPSKGGASVVPTSRKQTLARLKSP